MKTAPRVVWIIVDRDSGYCWSAGQTRLQAWANAPGEAHEWGEAIRYEKVKRKKKK